MAETAVVQVAEVKQGATGTSAKGQWTRYDLLDGNGERFATFSKSVFDAALPFAGKRAEVEYEQTDKGRKLLGVKEASTNGDTPPLGTGEYVTGQKPAIEARRIGASTAAHVAGQLTNAFLVHRNPGVEITQDFVRSVYDAMESHVYVQLARRGEYLGEPPF
jgi:hypothetical protein